MNNLVIKQDRPLHMVLVFVASIVLLSTVTWLILDKSHWAFIMAKITGNQQMREILQINRQLEKENEELRDKVLWLERNSDIDKQTLIGIRDQLVNLQDEFYKQKGELEFYKGIMSTTENSLGLNIQGLYIESLETNLYRYRIILTNVTKSDKTIEGNATIMFYGKSSDGAAKKLNLKDISTPERKNWKFKFKNFMRLEGSFTVPDGFVPNRINVSLISKGKQEKIAERSFEWSSVAN